MGLTAGFALILMLLAIALWVVAIVLLVKYWAKVVGLLGVLPVVPVGPVVTIIVVLFVKNQK